MRRATSSIVAAAAVLLVCALQPVAGSRWLLNTAEVNNATTNETKTEETCPPKLASAEGERFEVAKFDFWHVSTPLLVALWILFVSLCKVGFHSQKWLEKLMPESCLLIIVGVILGIILFYSEHGDDALYQLNTHTFFLMILPPIIMDAGYFMPSRSFFDQFGTILLYAILNTLLNALWFGFTMWGIGTSGLFGDLCYPVLHSLVFAAILSAVDPVAVLAVFESIKVNEMLYIIVFGEALLNDGIAVVLYKIFDGFSQIGAENVIGVDIVAGIGSFFVIVIGAPGIGIVIGLFGGFCSRFTHHVRIMEPMIVVVLCYMSFLIGEMFHLSGILSCTFCGITMRKYVEANISTKSQTSIKYIFKMLSSVAEAIIFMYLGIAAVSTHRVWNTAFILLTLLFCLVYRALGVILLALMANRVRLERLTALDQFIMSYGGLRGAIAFALSMLLDAELYPSRNLLITATIVEVYFTNLILGSTVEPLVKLLKVKRNEAEDPTVSEKITLRMIDHLMLAVEAVAQQRGHHHFREKFSQFNNNYLKPLIVGRHPRHEGKTPKGRGMELFRVYQRVSQRDAKQLTKNPNSARSLSRWSSVVLQNDRLPGMERNNTVYELPSYWRGSWVSMSDCESAGNSVRHIPTVDRHVGNGNLASAHSCKCNCHSPNLPGNGLTPNKSTDVLLLPSPHTPPLGDDKHFAFDSPPQERPEHHKNLASSSKRVSFNALDELNDSLRMDPAGAGSRNSNQYDNMTAISFTVNTAPKPTPASTGSRSPNASSNVMREDAIEMTPTSPSNMTHNDRVYENDAFDGDAAAESRDKQNWHF